MFHILKRRSRFGIKDIEGDAVHIGVTLCATYRKSFSIFAEGSSRPIWLPVYDAFRNPTIDFQIELSSIRLLFESAKIENYAIS
jgi:hypothetical protein